MGRARLAPANETARLDGAVTALGKTQRLVRIESLDYAIEHGLMPKLVAP